MSKKSKSDRQLSDDEWAAVAAKERAKLEAEWKTVPVDLTTGMPAVPEGMYWVVGDDSVTEYLRAGGRWHRYSTGYGSSRTAYEIEQGRLIVWLAETVSVEKIVQKKGLFQSEIKCLVDEEQRVKSTLFYYAYPTDEGVLLTAQHIAYDYNAYVLQRNLMGSYPPKRLS